MKKEEAKRGKGALATVIFQNRGSREEGKTYLL